MFLKVIDTKTHQILFVYSKVTDKIIFTVVNGYMVKHSSSLREVFKKVSFFMEFFMEFFIGSNSLCVCVSILGEHFLFTQNWALPQFSELLTSLLLLFERTITISVSTEQKCRIIHVELEYIPWSGGGGGNLPWKIVNFLFESLPCQLCTTLV